MPCTGYAYSLHYTETRADYAYITLDNALNTEQTMSRLH